MFGHGWRSHGASMRVQSVEANIGLEVFSATKEVRTVKTRDMEKQEQEQREVEELKKR